MAKHKCPMAEANKQAHQQLLDLFPTLEGRLASEGPTDALANDIIGYLTKWLTGHILKVDTHLRACQSVK